MILEHHVLKYANSWIWKDILKSTFLEMNLEFVEIMYIEELVKLQYYSGFIKVKSHSNHPEYIEVEVIFDKKGKPIISIIPTLLNAVKTRVVSRIILNKLPENSIY